MLREIIWFLRSLHSEMESYEPKHGVSVSLFSSGSMSLKRHDGLSSAEYHPTLEGTPWPPKRSTAVISHHFYPYLPRLVGYLECKI